LTDRGRHTDAETIILKPEPDWETLHYIMGDFDIDQNNFRPFNFKYQIVKIDFFLFDYRRKIN
jgi:hypothetical protein